MEPTFKLPGNTVLKPSFPPSLVALRGEMQAAAFVWLRDGRRIAYQEMGCTQQTATRSLLVLHGAFSSRLFAMPGISQSLLQEYGVRLVAIDRPGYGDSDPNPTQTLQSFTADMEELMGQLQMGAQVWLLGYSLGCIYCWAAARYIPDRLAGITLWAPAGSFEWQTFTSEELKAIKDGFAWKAQRQLYYLSRRVSFASLRQQVGSLCRQIEENPEKLDAFQRTLSTSDKQALNRPHIFAFVCRDRLKSVAGSANGFGVAKDFQLFSSTWGFEPEEINQFYRGAIHIWQGDDDNAVPLILQEAMAKRLPIVKLHQLKGEGHLSWFYFNEDGHRLTLSELFGTNNLPRARI